MNLHFVNKTFMRRKENISYSAPTKDEVHTEEPSGKNTPKRENKKTKKSSDMLTNEQIENAEAIVNAMEPEVKVVKKDRGLIERTESSKIILTEDNRQVLND